MKKRATRMKRNEAMENIVLDMFYYDPINAEIYRDPKSQYACYPSSIETSEKMQERWFMTPVSFRPKNKTGPLRTSFSVNEAAGEFGNRKLHLYKAQMVVTLVTGVWPEGHISFKDGNMENCKFENISFRFPEGAHTRRTQRKINYSPETIDQKITEYSARIAELKGEVVADSNTQDIPVQKPEPRVERNGHIEIPVTRKEPVKTMTDEPKQPSFTETLKSAIKKYVKF